jgi:anaerobic magnesium-protoporphyrin IX monomethyl ester cyclase
MRILLIYPPISKRERYCSAIGSAGGNQTPLGVFYLAAYLRQRDHQVEVIDGEARGLSAADIVDRAQEFRPELVGVSSTTVALHRAIEVADEIKRRWPELPIVIGGPHVSSNVHHGMSFPVFDYAVVGEGEATLEELARTIAAHGDLSAVQGIAYRQDGRVIVTEPRPRLTDLDSLPFPAYDLIPDLAAYTPPPCNYKKQPVANVITSRGCPNVCTFCDRSVFGQHLRQRSAANIAAEIEHLFHTYGVREIAFVDDTFTIRPARMRELFELLAAKKISFPWTCMSRINTVDRDTLEFMRKNGCWHVSFGIESGNEDILRRIKKNISMEQVHRVVGWCRELGLRTKGFFIIGHPGETAETMEQTIQFGIDLPLDDVVVTINTPIPGSQQHAEAQQYGVLDETDWAKFNYWCPVFVPFGLTQEMLLAKQKEFYRRFYLRPRILWRYGLSFLSPSGPRRFWTLCKTLPFLLKRKRQEPDAVVPPS